MFLYQQQLQFETNRHDLYENQSIAVLIWQQILLHQERHREEESRTGQLCQRKTRLCLKIDDFRI